MPQSIEPKNNFFFGLSVGIAVISTIAFLSLLFLVIKDKKIVEFDEPVAVAEAKDDQVPEQPTKAAVAQPEQKVVEVPGIKESEAVKGNKDSGIVIIEYSDYECPYCLKHNETMNQILDDFGDNVQYVFRNFPLSFHANAQKAAEAAECAHDQGKFWEMHDKLFEVNANKEMSVVKYKEIAKELGLDSAKFDTCLDNGDKEAKVKSDMAEGSVAGVKGTPATFVNGKMISGAVPYESFKITIENILSQ